MDSFLPVGYRMDIGSIIGLISKCLRGQSISTSASTDYAAYIFVCLAFTWGSLMILSTTLQFLKFLNRHITRQYFYDPDQLFNKYGEKGSWAVVTGGSDGIGFEMCKQLANQGFNICIVSRNEKKMIEKLNEIKSQLPKELKK